MDSCEGQCDHISGLYTLWTTDTGMWSVHSQKCRVNTGCEAYVYLKPSEELETNALLSLQRQ